MRLDKLSTPLSVTCSGGYVRQTSNGFSPFVTNPECLTRAVFAAAGGDDAIVMLSWVPWKSFDQVFRISKRSASRRRAAGQRSGKLDIVHYHGTVCSAAYLVVSSGYSISWPY